MSFIKTPYTIFEVVSETPIVYNVRAKWTPNHIYAKSKCQTKVIKQADTIEKLCDEFVLENKKDHSHLQFAELEIKVIVEYTNKEEWFIYGAIWTDKGLIYVAKMNNKGELELL